MSLTLDGLSGTAVAAGYGNTIAITDTTITNSGDGIDIEGPTADVTITDSTISGNSVGVDSTDPSSGISLAQSTIAGNSDGIEGSLAGVSVAGSIVGDNSASDCAMTTGTLTDNGYNDNGDGTCGFSAGAHSLTHTDPALSALGDHGSPTDTQEPAPTSAVIGQIPPGTTGNGVTLCPSLDQRGVARPQGSDCDMGAVEDNAPQVSGIFPPTGLTTVHTSVTITGTGFTGATSVSFGGSPATGITVNSDSSLTASSPLGTSGTVAVTVTGPTGTSGSTRPAVHLHRESDPHGGGLPPHLQRHREQSRSGHRDGLRGDRAWSAPGSRSTVNTATAELRGRYDYLAPVSTLSTSASPPTPW